MVQDIVHDELFFEDDTLEFEKKTVNHKGYQKRDGKIYPVTCNDTAYIPILSVKCFSVTRVFTKRLNMTSEKEVFILLKTQPSLNLKNH